MTGPAIMPTKDVNVSIEEMRTFLIEGKANGGDYFNQASGHWLTSTDIANPMSHYEKYKSTRSSRGIDVMGSFCVEIEASNGVKGFATGFGGSPACFLAETHFKRFLIGADPRDTNLLWDQMYRASLYYGRKGLAIAIISVIDLAIWDLLGKLRNEPVYKMIGGRTKDFLPCYCTGPRPDVAKKKGFWGGKVPLPFGPNEPNSLQKNFDDLRRHRESVGPDFPIMVDCYMSLNVNYAIELATKCLELHIEWWEEVLHPDDSDGYTYIKRALPQLKWTTGEHEYTRYGFRKLIEGRNIDLLQPDVMWCGGLTELLKISAHASAYDIPIVPHGSGPYSFHFVISQTNAPFVEYVANSADGHTVLPTFGNLFLNEPVPANGRLEISDLRGPGFGLQLNPNVRLIPFTGMSKTTNGTVDRY